MAAPKSVASDVEGMKAITNGLTQTILGDNTVNTNVAVATPARTDDIDAITNGLGQAILGEDEEAISNGLTQTILGDNAVNTNLTVATPARTDDIDAITSGLGQAILGEDVSQRLATEEKAAEKEDQGAKLDEASSAEHQIPEQAEGSHTEEREDAVDALGAACSSWSLETEEEAEARREAQRLRDQIQKKHEDNMKALENAEAKRRADEECDALERELKAQIDGARLRKMKRKARKEKDQEAARELRVAAEAEAVVIAERRARQERQAHDEARELQAKREADNKARLELSEAYGRIIHNATIAEANARQAELQQQQREAELIAQYHEVVARQVQFAELQQRQQRQQEELILQQQHAELQQRQQRQQEELILQQQLAELERQRQEELFFQQHHAYPLNGQVSDSIEEMDTAPEMEASGGTEMEWEIEEVKSRLPAELPPPSSPPAPEPSAPAQGLPSPNDSLTAVKETVNKAKAENSSPRSSSPLVTMASMVATATPEPAATAPLHLPSLREALKARRIHTRSQVRAASSAPPQAAATPQPSLAPAPPRAAVPPVAPPPAQAAPPASVAAASPPPPASPLAPPPARPAPSIPALTIVFQKRAIKNPTLVAMRPTVNASSPLGRLLSQHKAIPKATLTQVLGKRAREDWGEGGREKKLPKFEGEFRLQVGGKRKREDEEFLGKKRAFLSRELAVPCSRFAASRSTLAPTSTPPTHPPTPAPSTLSAPPLPPLGPLQVNPHGGLAEAIEFHNDLPTLRREIAWMKAQRRSAATRKKTSIGSKATKRTATQASYWSKYRENLSR